MVVVVVGGVVVVVGRSRDNPRPTPHSQFFYFSRLVNDAERCVYLSRERQQIDAFSGEKGRESETCDSSSSSGICLGIDE